LSSSVRKSERKRVPNAVLGAIFAVVLLVASYFAFTKDLPWGGGTEYKAVFNSAQNLRVNSPVRIAGVEAGKVTSVEPLSPEQSEEAFGEVETAEDSSTVIGDETDLSQGGAVVTMEFTDDALPLKEDATFKLRPRLFLEGNLFVEVRPGSPSAPVMDPEGAPFPPSQTANSVQLDQILTSSLQADVRKDLQVFLDEFGTALIDGGGAESFRTLYRTSPGSYKFTSQVNDALLGENPNDLSGLIKNLDSVVRALGTNEKALQDLIVNLNVVGGSFASEADNLERAITELPLVLEAADPALANLNAAFPPLRAFAREALPGVESAPETLRAATPLLEQLRLLSSPSELRGLANDLVPAVPALASLSERTPDFLEEARALASCFNQVIIPWSLDEVEPTASYPLPVVGPVYKETAYGLTGLNGESRSQDANGQYIRVAAGGGTNTVETIGQAGEALAGVTALPIQGAMPSQDSSARTEFRPDEPCENQEAPNLGALDGPGPQNSVTPPPMLRTSQGSPDSAEEVLEAQDEIVGQLNELGAATKAGEGLRAEKRATEKLVQKYYEEFGN
jgi:phospholipid/cholesterol/gamma-HCH transport system substrate-binding protein